MTTQNPTFRVALVCMPFCRATVPSIQIGLLHAIAEQAGYPTESFHFNVDLAARITPVMNKLLNTRGGHMLGEWLFSVAAFGPDGCGSDDAYFAAFPDDLERVEAFGKGRDYLSWLRHEELPRFIDECLEAADWERFRVVGFSSTFQQHVASLALAQRIKRRYPSVTVVFGGANMDGEMGPAHVRAFPYIDYAVVGEADTVFPELLGRLAAGRGPAGLRGVIGRGVEEAPPANPMRDLDALPIPDYRDYFERAGASACFGIRITDGSFPSRAHAGAGGARNTTAPSAA